VKISKKGLAKKRGLFALVATGPFISYD